jgi:Right handed beta helix region
MNLTRTLAALAAFATTALLFAAPASAQATRTWVSGVGDDANPCSRTAPCKTFAGAISKTAAAGEINCLDPGGFGAATITKSITINCAYDIGRAGVLVSGTNGIVVAGGTQVQLIGLDIDGIGTGLSGVLVNASNVNVMIQDCVIYEFQTAPTASPGPPAQGNGIYVTGQSSKVYVQNSIIRNNSIGVAVYPSAGAATVELDHVVLDNNTTTVTGYANLSVGTGGQVILTNSTITSGAAVVNGGSIFSYGNNVIRGSITGTALTAQALQ